MNLPKIKKQKLKLTKEQMEGVDWILNTNFKKHKGGILADIMGLGKTAQAIEVIKQKSHRPALIICPAYLTYNWIKELEKWDAYNNVCVIDSGKQKLFDANIYLMSYEMACKDYIFSQLMKKDYGVLVLDEFHYCKSWKSKRSTYILGTFRHTVNFLAKRAENILGLTGTPMLKNIEDLYNLVIRIAPKSLHYMKKDTFIHTYAAQVYHTPWGLKHEGVKNLKGLKTVLKDVMLRRTKIEGLKDRHDKTIYVPVKGKSIEKLIQQEENFLKEHGLYESDIRKMKNMSDIDISVMAEIRQKTAIYKIPSLLSSLENLFESTNNMLIYCYHRNVQQALFEKLDKKYKKKTIEIINGSVSHKKRNALVEKFQKGEIDILLATISSLREGVNITGTNTVCFLELDWTHAYNEQAIGRVHRKGQKDEVYCYYYMLDCGIDAHILRIVETKKKITEKVLK